jgi:hypothetical protein
MERRTTRKLIGAAMRGCRRTESGSDVIGVRKPERDEGVIS